MSEPAPCSVTSIDEAPVPSAVDFTNIDNDDEVPPAGSSTTEDCDCEGCIKDSDRPVPFQPRDPAILSQFTQGKWKFLPSWYSVYKRVTHCTKQKKVFCMFCPYTKARKMVTFSVHSEPAFTNSGFDNHEKAVEKLTQHKV